MNLRKTLVTASVVSVLSACSGGATVGAGNQSSDEANGQTTNQSTNEPADEVVIQPEQQTVSADNALSRSEATRAINDPINKTNEPRAIDWVSNDGMARQAQCVDGSQDAIDAFSTRSFVSAIDGSGEFLVSTSVAANQAPEYIEFCFNVPTRGRYQFVTSVRAPSINEDSFYVTINEDTPGSVPIPGIYDVSRSTAFKDDLIQTRTQNPLISILEPGTVTLRLYAREPNTAIRSVRLDGNVEGVPSFNPEIAGTTALAQCAANTGMHEDEIESLIKQYIGNVPRRFVLTYADEERFYSDDAQTQFTSRHDYQWLTDDGLANIMCLADPPARGNLIDNTIPAGHIVFGSQGYDEHRLNTPLRGTFIGNGGDDEVGTLEEGGVFIGDEGDDQVRTMLGGLFEGGAGDDLVIGARGGTFLGGSGDDQATSLTDAFFDGGDGFDSIERVSDLATYTSVESVGNSFASLLPPTNLRFADMTQSSAVVSWDSSLDERVTGYVVSEVDDFQINIDRLVDIGADPLSIGRYNTFGNQVVIDRFNTDERLVQIRGYRALDDGSYIYSPALEARYMAPDDTPLQILASRELMFDPLGVNFDYVTLADDESVVQVNWRTPTLFINYGTRLESTTELTNENLVLRSTYSSQTRQYVASTNPRVGDDPTRISAFSGDGLTELWVQEIPVEPGISDFDDCQNGFTTQDDWLVCYDFNVGVLAVDPQGTIYSHPTAEIAPVRIADADQGLLVRWVDQESVLVMNLFNGQQTSLDTNIEDYLPGEGVWLVNGLAVKGDQAVIAGAQDHVCPFDDIGACRRAGNSAQSFFLARISLTTGEVLKFVSKPLESRPVPDTRDIFASVFGQIIDDTVVFAYRNYVNSYDFDSLEELERQVVIGDVQSVSEDVVLTERAIVVDGNTQVGVDLFVIER